MKTACIICCMPEGCDRETSAVGALGFAERYGMTRVKQMLCERHYMLTMGSPIVADAAIKFPEVPS